MKVYINNDLYNFVDTEMILDMLFAKRQPLLTPLARINISKVEVECQRKCVIHKQNSDFSGGVPGLGPVAIRTTPPLTTGS